MNKRSIVVPVLLSIIVVNAAGAALKYFEQPAYIILMGFRFHISAVLPFIFVISRLNSMFIKNEFINPGYKKNYPFVMSLFLLPFLIAAVLYYLEYLDIGDPEYFYEFGMSSIVDLPVYLIWNAPQLIMFYLFLTVIYENVKLKKIFVFGAAIIPFLFEFIPVDGTMPDLYSAGCLLIMGILNMMIINKFRNIYWFVVFNFLLLWMPLLLFGSESASLVKIIFASRYNIWEGFLELNKKISIYAIPGFILSVSIIFALFYFLTKKENPA